MCWDTACSHIILPPRSAQTSTWTFTTQNTKWSKTQLAQQNFHQETYKSKLLYLECSISWLVTRGESMFGDSPNSESQPSLEGPLPTVSWGLFRLMIMLPFPEYNNKQRTLVEQRLHRCVRLQIFQLSHGNTSFPQLLWKPLLRNMVRNHDWCFDIVKGALNFPLLFCLSNYAVIEFELCQGAPFSGVHPQLPSFHQRHCWRCGLSWPVEDVGPARGAKDSL